jgi:putative transcriptional regulator
VGYSGWEPGQLEDEIAQKSWIVTNQYPQNLIFENEVDELWKKVVTNLGPKFAHLANFPENPMWN